MLLNTVKKATSKNQFLPQPSHFIRKITGASTQLFLAIQIQFPPRPTLLIDNFLIVSEFRRMKSWFLLLASQKFTEPICKKRSNSRHLYFFFLRTIGCLFSLQSRSILSFSQKVYEKLYL